MLKKKQDAFCGDLNAKNVLKEIRACSQPKAVLVHPQRFLTDASNDLHENI